MMDVSSLLRKLEPLKPDDVKRWRHAVPLVDESTRRLIEQHVIVMARRLLGDYERTLLLPPPPASKANGPIRLGTVLYDKERGPFGISEGELLQHLAIFGRSGAGKTNVVFGLLLRLAERGIPFLLVDWKRTGRHLLPLLKDNVRAFTVGRSLSPFPFNPFIPPPGLERRVYVSMLIDALATAFTLGDGAKSLLESAITASYESTMAPTVQDVLSHLEAMTSTGRTSGWRTTAVRALRSLDFAGLQGGSADEQERLAARLLDECTILETDSLSANAKQFFVTLLVVWLFHARLARPEREQLKLVVVIEEAHHVFHRLDGTSRESALEMVLRQCREVGMSIILVDQHPSQISKAVLGNTQTTIVLNLKEPSDIAIAARMCLLADSEKQFLSELGIGRGIVKLQSRWTRPFLVQFPLVPMSKGAVTDDVLSRHLSSATTGSGRIDRLHRMNEQIPRVPRSDQVLEDGAFTFLADVLAHPHDGVKARYRRLGLGTGKGDRMKDSLLRLGLLDHQVISIGRSRKVVLMPTSKARSLFPRTQGEDVHASAQHEYWKRYYAQRYRDKGYDVVLEAPRQGGRVDVLATKGDERLGIEIETGKSDAVENLRNCLRSRFTKVIVVATDEKAMDVLELAFGRVGLLLPHRVSLLLRGSDVPDVSTSVE